MNKEQTLAHNSSRVTFKELQQIIKMGLVQGNLIPAFAGSWLAIVLANHSFLVNTTNLNDVSGLYVNYGGRMCFK